MDSLSRMNKALAYIEEHLTEEIDYREVAKIAHCSEYHFKRMFSFLSGIGLSEYIRRRRLTLAALDLKDTNLRIIDIAIKYGYDSADSFSRAFHSIHGILPSEARGENAQVKAFPRMTFQLSIKGGCEMNYRIVEKGPFKVVGFKKRVPIVFEGVNPEIAKMTQLLTPEVVKQLKALSNVEPRGIISASVNFSEGRMEEKGMLDHYIGVATSSDETGTFDVLNVEAGTWAVFESIGPFPETLQNVWGRIYSEWFPSSGYEEVEGPEILWNESPDTGNPKYRSEIWIPVKKKGE
ncbi:AraC family transcriptional regulator [Neobacillus thermocopriae]|uniref:AraC family transcriptional regulator n=1 Tax=Neobacillus thermocopriae TaxID=1215031 RepID=A0A6B3TW94_9BACI|nr:AraC family transcriptional regulator [Neobacillus thermocopriae]MED3624630.1 AraC family transcriptional regulator [Neobacillus thermocopriae]MED3715741.1 AraC family transcriptional regulator [Neobacillus thermocopriae]NEX80221.1 AraC family transcriptional regulator [Neobacillus thermocopriae]